MVIDLLPNTSPLKAMFIPFQIPETKAMEKYIEEALSYVFIRSSTSPAASGFFSLLKRKMEAYDPVLTIEHSTQSLLRIAILCPLSHLLLNSCGNPGISPSWTIDLPTISSESGKVMNGRRLFSPPGGTTST